MIVGLAAIFRRGPGKQLGPADDLRMNFKTNNNFIFVIISYY